MSIYVRIRNGMTPDDYTGDGGASEGDIRGNSNDLIDNTGVVDKDGGHALVHEADTPAMSVLVDEGIIYIPNTAYDEFDSDSIKFWEAVVAGTDVSRTLSIDSNSSGFERIDLVCAYLDPGAEPDENASDVAELLIVKGTPGAGSPAVPSFHEAIASVSVANGAVSILDANITDLREQVMLRQEVLPFKPKRVTTVTTSETPTPNIDTTDVYEITALADAAEFGEPTGTPTNAQPLLYRIKDDGTARALTWNAIYRPIEVNLPETTVANKTMYVGMLWNSAASKWDVIAVVEEE